MPAPTERVIQPQVAELDSAPHVPRPVPLLLAPRDRHTGTRSQLRLNRPPRRELPPTRLLQLSLGSTRRHPLVRRVISVKRSSSLGTHDRPYVRGARRRPSRFWKRVGAVSPALRWSKSENGSPSRLFPRAAEPRRHRHAPLRSCASTRRVLTNERSMSLHVESDGWRAIVFLCAMVTGCAPMTTASGRYRRP